MAEGSQGACGDYRMDKCKDQRIMCGKLFSAKLESISERLNGMDKALDLKSKELESRYINKLSIIALIFVMIQIILQTVFVFVTVGR